MSRPETWPAWQPHPGGQAPGLGGMSQLAAYEAGLTDDPGCWARKIETYWSPKLDPASPEYSPEFADAVAWEEPGPGDFPAADPCQTGTWPQTEPGPDAEPELPF